jgi:hypothetical protein
MDQYRRGRNIKTLWAVVLFGITYSSSLYYQCTLTGVHLRCAVRSLRLLSCSCQFGGNVFLRVKCSTSVSIEIVRCFAAVNKYAGPPDQVDRHFCQDDTIYR